MVDSTADIFLATTLLLTQEWHTWTSGRPTSSWLPSPLTPRTSGGERGQSAVPVGCPTTRQSSRPNHLLSASSLGSNSPSTAASSQRVTQRRTAMLMVSDVAMIASLSAYLCCSAVTLKRWRRHTRLSAVLPRRGFLPAPPAPTSSQQELGSPTLASTPLAPMRPRTSAFTPSLTPPTP